MVRSKSPKVLILSNSKMSATTRFTIRNMVCARCIASVERILTDLGIENFTVELGIAEGVIRESVSIEELENKLEENGFELIEDADSTLIEAIKRFVIENIRNENKNLDSKWSDIISRKFVMDYSTISKTFSEVAGLTLERFIILQKIERIKEWLRYDELSISEMAWKLDYSSPHHLSNQFKSVTGMSPTQFKKNLSIPRLGLDRI